MINSDNGQLRSRSSSMARGGTWLVRRRRERALDRVSRFGWLLAAVVSILEPDHARSGSVLMPPVRLRSHILYFTLHSATEAAWYAVGAVARSAGVSDVVYGSTGVAVLVIHRPVRVAVQTGVVMVLFCTKLWTADAGRPITVKSASTQRSRERSYAFVEDQTWRRLCWDSSAVWAPGTGST